MNRKRGMGERGKMRMRKEGDGYEKKKGDEQEKEAMSRQKKRKGWLKSLYCQSIYLLRPPSLLGNSLGVIMGDLGGQVHVRVGADAVEKRREGERRGVRLVVRL